MLVLVSNLKNNGCIITGMLIREVLLVIVIGMLILSPVTSQTITIHDPELQYLLEDSLFQTNNYHSVFKPVQVSYNNFLNYFPGAKLNTLWSFRSNNLNHPNIIATPIIDAEGISNNADHCLLYRFGQGLIISGSLNKTIGFEISGELIEQGFPSTYRYSIDSLRLIPGYNLILHGYYPNVQYSYLNGFIYWNIIPHLSLKAGNDKQFLGDGDRSLYLSEYAASYPFVQLNLNVWKIRYSYQVLFSHDLVSGAGNKRFDKYIVMHTLNYNVNKKFNIYAFETVVWRAQDSTFHRSLDINYLNPFLLLRPVEWSIGSPDNMLLGFGARWSNTMV